MTRQFLLLPAFLLLLPACAGTRHRRDRDHRVHHGADVAAGQMADGGLAVRGRTAVDEVPLEVERIVANFKRVHFDTASAQLTLDGQVALQSNADLLVRYADVAVEVQGHADERGTTDFNLALGHRRAMTIQRYLEARGVPASRVRAATFGEERPLDGAGGQTAWAANRRAEFRVTWGGDGLVQGTVEP